MDDHPTKRDWAYCRGILQKVSRTFALTITQLHGDIFKVVLLGYLLFRIADTFEDNVYQEEEKKIADLEDFSEVFRGNKDLDQRLRLYESLKFRWNENSYEKNLIENGSRVLRCYFDISETYRRIIDPLLVQSSQGMAKFQRRKLESKTAIFQLADIKELEDYCYYVAGIVGVMLTKVFCERESIREKRSELETFEIHFGLALQLINIIKDYEKDIARGWCYIPLTLTENYHIKLDRIDALSTDQRQGILQELIPRAVRYLDSTLKYIELLPLHETSIRTFCILPFVIGYRTLAKVVQMEGNKISREEVASIINETALYAKSNNALQENYLEIRGRYLIAGGDAR
jgi:farnesyl-diphosphate farnesyltransferase